MVEKLQTARWTTAVVENFIFCGFILGWHNLQNIFANEGFFCNNGVDTIIVDDGTEVTNSTTDNVLTTCDFDYQSTQLTLAFSISVAIMPVSTVIIGSITNTLGTVKIRCILHLVWIIGFVLFMVAVPNETDILITAGCCCLAAAGLNMAITNYPAAHLSGDKHGTVLSVMCGAFDESAAMGLVLFSMYGALGVTTTFTAMVVLSAVMLIRTLTLMPKTIFPFHADENYQVDSVCCGPSGDHFGSEEEMMDLDIKKTEDTEKETSLTSSITNPIYLTMMIFFPFQTLRCYYFLATSHDWMHEMICVTEDCNSAEEIEALVNFGKTFSYFLMSAIFISPISGVVIDKSMAFFTSGDSVNPAHGTLAVHMAITTIFGALYSLLAWTQIISLQYITFFLFVIHRSFTFAGVAAFVGMLFPSIQFSGLFGLMNAISVWTGFGPQIFGLFSFTVSQANLFFTGLLLVALFHPVLVYMKGKNH